jgi:hypothetical protein
MYKQDWDPVLLVEIRELVLLERDTERGRRMRVWGASPQLEVDSGYFDLSGCRQSNSQKFAHVLPTNDGGYNTSTQTSHGMQIMRMACVIVIDSSQYSRHPTAFNPPKLRWYCEPTICRDKRHAVKSS